MSYGLSVYLVDLALVRGAIGSGDVKLRRMIGGRFKQKMAQADEWFEDQIQDGAPPRYEALRAVIEGGPFDKNFAFQYGYAYQMICEFHGRYLFNNHFSPFRGAWLEEVDKGFEQLGVKAVGVKAVYDTPPAPIPSSDLPCYGEWTVEACREGLAQWAASPPEQRDEVDDEVLAAIESCVDWMREADAHDRGIAIFMA
ncbi:DUF7691 family protein [Pseudonocardia sp. TRM90224]|uniref:DUF7691 family protein n=1 Tax=Pseudonocardia sp. TRM90224 TaxID=2812678 RepID=UPI001E5BBC93|nr:hypothetical protein [Pseudonocardia sp. TRM90224]